MRIVDLTREEQLVLLGLVKVVIHADQVVSEEEREALRAIRDGLEAEAWNELVRAAATAFPTLEALEQRARAIERPEAQRFIHDRLVELAGSDEIIPEEAHVLGWVSHTWGMLDDEDDVELDDEDDEEEEILEAFVLFDEE